MIRTAIDPEKAEMIIYDGNLVNVCSREIYKCDVVIKGNRIARLGNVSREKLTKSSASIIDAKGLYLSPGLFDAHLHLESSMLTLTEFSRAVLPHGTTDIVLDPHEIANVAGSMGIRALMDESKLVPLRVFFMVPSCVPSAPSLETAGAEISVDDAREILMWERVLGLGEVMNYLGVLNLDEELLRKITVARELKKTIDGHAPSLKGSLLNAYVSAGILSDHESTTSEEVVEKLRLGMHLMLREGSAAKNLSSLLPPLTKSTYPTRHCMLVTDDLCASDILVKGHMDFVIRRAIEEGLDPIDAFQMVTINPAEYFGLEKYLGSITPGKRADVIIFENLEKPNIKMTIVDGNIVAKDKKILYSVTPFRFPDTLRKTFHLKREVIPDDFIIRSSGSAEKRKVKLIKAFDGEIFTKHLTADIIVHHGLLRPPIEKDIIQIAVVERHRKTGNIGIGFVRGFGLKSGCMASSVAHDSHNIVAIGTNKEDMAYAVNRLVELQGGLVVANNKKVLGELHLPICGLVSEEKIEKVSSQMERINILVQKLGCTFNQPFMTMSFLALPVIPELKLTDKGLIDVEKSRIVSVFDDNVLE